MNAISIAVLLSSFFAASHPVYAASIPEKPPKVQSESTHVDINHATLADLTGSFKGIGKKRAEAMIAYRESHHGFKSIEELADVKGFGPNFVKKNRAQLTQLFIIK